MLWSFLILKSFALDCKLGVLHVFKFAEVTSAFRYSNVGQFNTDDFY